MPPARDMASAFDMETTPRDDGGTETDSRPDTAVPGVDELSVRSRDHQIHYWAPAGTGNVWLAGNFTWPPLALAGAMERSHSRLNSIAKSRDIRRALRAVFVCTR